MMTMHTRLISALSLIAASAMLPTTATAQNSEGLRAAIVYNILRFAEFRRPADSGRRTLCVAANAYTPAFGALEGEALPNARLDVRRYAPGASLNGCDAVYVGDARPPEVNALTIGDSSEFISRGGVVGLVRFGREIRFEIAPAAGNRVGVTFSSRLLRLAIIRRG
jgi:hypothetical protein